MKKISVVLLIIFISFSLGGCWSSEEPKDLAIINSIIYDCDEEGNYYITVQIINTSAIVSSGTSTSGDKNPSIIVKGKGPSMSDAFNDLTCRVEKSLFAAHNKVRFLSERLVSDEFCFKKFLDFIFRDTITDETSIMVVVRDDDIDKIYKSAIGLATLTGTFFEEMHYKKQEQSSSAVFYRTFEFVREYYEEGIEPVLGQLILLPTVETPSLNPGGEMKEAKYELKSEGLAVFKGLKFVGYLDDHDTEIYNVVINNAKLVNFNLFEEGDTVSLSISRPKSDVKVSKQGEQVYVDIKVKGDVTMSNFFIYGVNDENNNDKVKEIEAEANRFLAQTTLDSVKKGMELGSDIYGFGRSLHISDPTSWREIAKDWDTYFQNAVVNVEYKINLTREGEIDKPFIKEQ
jgi:spore germination protein KC